MPSPLQLAHYRAQVKRFAEFTDEEWAIFSECLYLRVLPKKQLLISAGEVCKEVGFIYNGSLRLYFLKDGIEVSNYFLFANEFVSSYRSFLKQLPSEVFIEAMEYTELVCFLYSRLQSLLAHPITAFRMEQFGRKIAEYLICCYDERVLSFITQSPEQRYLSLLQEQPQWLQKVPQHYLANYLGITPVSLSRIRRRVLAAASQHRKAS